MAVVVKDLARMNLVPRGIGAAPSAKGTQRVFDNSQLVMQEDQIDPHVPKMHRLIDPTIVGSHPDYDDTGHDVIVAERLMFIGEGSSNQLGWRTVAGNAYGDIQDDRVGMHTITSCRSGGLTNLNRVIVETPNNVQIVGVNAINFEGFGMSGTLPWNSTASQYRADDITDVRQAFIDHIGQWVPITLTVAG